MSNEVILEAKDICKSFSGVQVLKSVHFAVRKGEVHALMGENGAGKSTLIKILTGAYTKDSGTIEWKGKPVEIHCLGDCQALGMSCIYQELSVIPALTVAQNVFLGREPRRFGVIDHKKMNQMTTELIERYNFPLEATTPVSELGIGVRQLVEILKGLSCNAELLIMDEPTASLSGKEAETLFRIIEQLRERGVAIIYISHRLEEVYRLSDRLTVLRDGRNEVVLEHDDIDPKKVIQYMIGKVVDESAGSIKEMRAPTGEALLKVEHLSNLGNFHDVSFTLHKGEILGFGGLIGAGRTELVRAIYGIDSFTEGCITFDGQTYCKPSPKKSIRAGFGFVPEDPPRPGLHSAAVHHPQRGADQLRYYPKEGPRHRREERAGHGGAHHPFHRRAPQRPRQTGGPDERRQPAEGGAGQMAGAGPETAHRGRAHRRHRRGRQG